MKAFLNGLPKNLRKSSNFFNQPAFCVRIRRHKGIQTEKKRALVKREGKH